MFFRNTLNEHQIFFSISFLNLVPHRNKVRVTIPVKLFKNCVKQLQFETLLERLYLNTPCFHCLARKCFLWMPFMPTVTWCIFYPFLSRCTLKSSIDRFLKYLMTKIRTPKFERGVEDNCKMLRQHDTIFQSTLKPLRILNTFGINIPDCCT